jgi:CheY-like chemotaxis protein
MLTAIIGYSDISLIKLSGDDPLRRNIEEIRRAAERSASLTSQLLAFSRQQVLQPKIVNFNELVGETIKMLGRLIGENISVEVNLSDQVGFIEADPAQLTQVLVNLAVNARDAMPTGGTLSITTEKIEYRDELPISSESILNGKVVRLTVHDTGEGIDPQHLPFVFEPFFTTKEVGKGTGLGLATVYGIVKQSSGEILVESLPGSGTTFNVYFPCVDIDSSENSESVRRPQLPSGGSERILIVEDEEMVRELARILLEEEGYEVVTAANGAEALELGTKIGGAIDLVITDLVMPQMSGIEFARHLKAIHPNIPILFTSGYTEDKSFLYEIRDDKVDFLSKPFVVEALVAKVRDFLDNCRK